MHGIAVTVALVSCVGLVILVIFAVAAAVMAFRVRRAMTVVSAYTPPAAVAFSPQHHGMAFIGILTGSDDYGSWPPEAPARMLASSWGVTDGPSAVAAIEGMLDTPATGDALAFDRVRGGHLARAAAGAQFIDQATSWAYVARAGRDLQREFHGWGDVGDAYLRAKNAWLSARSIPTDDGTEARVEQLRAGVWTVIPFGMHLG